MILQQYSGSASILQKLKAIAVDQDTCAYWTYVHIICNNTLRTSKADVTVLVANLRKPLAPLVLEANLMIAA